MTPDHLRLLRASVDKHVRIICTDGEVLVAKIHLVSEKEQDVIYDVVSTSQTPGSEHLGSQSAYVVRFADIDSVEPL